MEDITLWGKKLTKEQAEVLDIVLAWEKTQFWKFILEQMEKDIKNIEDILCGRKEEKWLDDIKYSMNTVYREKMKYIEWLKKYPDTIKKFLWVVEVKNDNNPQT